MTWNRESIYIALDKIRGNQLYFCLVYDEGKTTLVIRFTPQKLYVTFPFVLQRAGNMFYSDNDVILRNSTEIKNKHLICPNSLISGLKLQTFAKNM